MRSTIPFVLPFVLVAAVPAVAAEAISVPSFRSIELRGGGEITVRPGAEQRVVIVDGSSSVTRFRVNGDRELEIDACENRCPQNYRLRIEIVTPSVPNAAISGGGHIRFAPGFAPTGHLSIAVNGGGQIDARSVSASNMAAAVNGGGRVLTGRSLHLSAAVNGGGEVRYADAEHVSSAVRGGGAVHRGE